MSYPSTLKVQDPHKAMVNRCVAVWTDNGTKIALESPKMMGPRMAESAGDRSVWHVANIQTLPDVDSNVQVTRHQGAFIDVLRKLCKSPQFRAKFDVVYADYCGTPLATSGPIKKNPLEEAKMISTLLRRNGMAIFTFCKRGCTDAINIATRLLEQHLDLAHEYYEYSNMVVFFCVRKDATKYTRTKARSIVYENIGMYNRRGKADTISPEEKAIVAQHKGDALNVVTHACPTECQACLKWAENDSFVENDDTCICASCFAQVLGDEYTVKDDKIVWNETPVVLMRDATGQPLNFGDSVFRTDGDGIVYSIQTIVLGRDSVQALVSVSGSLAPTQTVTSDQIQKMSGSIETALENGSRLEIELRLQHKLTKHRAFKLLERAIEIESDKNITQLIMDRIKKDMVGDDAARAQLLKTNDKLKAQLATAQRELENARQGDSDDDDVDPRDYTIQAHYQTKPGFWPKYVKDGDLPRGVDKKQARALWRTFGVWRRQQCTSYKYFIDKEQIASSMHFALLALVSRASNQSNSSLKRKGSPTNIGECTKQKKAKQLIGKEKEEMRKQQLKDGTKSLKRWLKEKCNIIKWHKAVKAKRSKFPNDTDKLRRKKAWGAYAAFCDVNGLVKLMERGKDAFKWKLRAQKGISPGKDQFGHWYNIRLKS